MTCTAPRNNVIRPARLLCQARTALALMLLAAAPFGCNVHRTLFGATSDHMLIGRDALARPGQEITVAARLVHGGLFSDVPDRIVRFYLNGRLYATAITDETGLAFAVFTPDRAGDFTFRAACRPGGDEPPVATDILLACRDETAPVAVVDLDNTLARTILASLLRGDPAPLPGSQAVMKRLAERYTIVYVTHRPEQLRLKSKAWLLRHGYPPGAMLMPTFSRVFRGAEACKREILAEVRKRFGGQGLGIGDRFSDVRAYRAYGLRAFLLFSPVASCDGDDFRWQAWRLGWLDESVQVVTDWSQIARGVFEGASFGRAAAQERLRRRAAAAIDRD